MCVTKVSFKASSFYYLVVSSENSMMLRCKNFEICIIFDNRLGARKEFQDYYVLLINVCFSLFENMIMYLSEAKFNDSRIRSRTLSSLFVVCIKENLQENVFSVIKCFLLLVNIYFFSLLKLVLQRRIVYLYFNNQGRVGCSGRNGIVGFSL